VRSEGEGMRAACQRDLLTSAIFAALVCSLHTVTRVTTVPHYLRHSTRGSREASLGAEPP
jgi:hypothetical protein